LGDLYYYLHSFLQCSRERCTHEGFKGLIARPIEQRQQLLSNDSSYSINPSRTYGNVFIQPTGQRIINDQLAASGVP
jgi:hypothetical protein